VQRIDDPSNIPSPQTPLATVSPGYFRRPSVAAGDQGTILTADWANDVQENIVQAILAGGISLSKGDGSLLNQAIAALIDTDVAAHAAIIASESILGHLEVATTGEVQNLLNNARALTPGNLIHSFDYGSNANGEWLALPTNVASSTRLGFQWGEQAISQNYTITLPTTMANANYYAHVSPISSNASNYRFHSHTTTQFEGSHSNHPADTGRFFVFGLLA